MIDDTKSLFSNYFHLIIGNIFGSSIVNFVSLFLIVRILSPTNYGSYVLFISVASIVAILTTWTSASIVRFGREEFITEGSVRKTFWANYGILLPAFAICLILVSIFKSSLSNYIGISQSACYLIFVYILLSNLSSNTFVAFQSMGRMKYYSYLPLISSGGFMLAIIVIYFASVTISVEMLVGFLVLGQLLITIIGLYLLRKNITPIGISMSWVKKCFFYSWPLFFGSMSGVGVQYIDQMVIGMFLALSFVGIYNIAYQLQGYLIMLPLLSVSLMFPLMTSLIVTKDELKIGQYIRVYAPQITFLWAIIVSIFLIFSREIVSLFGVNYVTASLPLMILFLCLSFRIFSIIESPVLSSYGLIKQGTVVNIAIGVTNLALDFLLIPRMGIMGAAVATAIAFTLGAFVETFILKKKLGMNNYRNYPWLFPAIASFVGAMLIDGLAYRIVFLAVVVIISVLIAKRSSVFSLKSLAILDSIDMPSPVRQVVKQVYSVLT